MEPDKRLAAEKSRRFLAIAEQFRLGGLVTEQSHPRSRNLSETLTNDTAAGVEMLFDVDRDVIYKYRAWSAGDDAGRIARLVAEKLRGGGRLFFTGCGATGRLSIQLTAMWRDYWQRQTTKGIVATNPDCDWENRAFSVIAGGDFALIKSVEGFEDYAEFGRRQIEDLGVSEGDVVFSITEGGETSFVIGTAWHAFEQGARVFFVYNNPDDLLCREVRRSREVIQEPGIEKINLTTGPMAITGSTRMQATSIQLCVMTTLLEMVLAMILKDPNGEVAPDETISSIPADFLSGLEEMHATLQEKELRRQVARLIEREESVYRRGDRNNYFADRLAIDVLTDTTERSPTFCIPAFKKFDDPEAAESWSFLFLRHAETPAAWRGLLKRQLQAVSWTKETVGELIGKADLDRQYAIVRAIGREEILRFRIGLDGLAHRPTRAGDSVTAMIAEAEIDELLAKGGFFRESLERADVAGGVVSVVFLGRRKAIARVDEFLDSWNVPVLRVMVPLPETSLLLDGVLRVGTKMLLNAISTSTMVRLGRVMENVMIWVVPSNLKLIDRSIRYIQRFTEISYEAACLLLHESIEYVAPRMKTGKAYPSTVGLCIIVYRDRCGFAEAEAKLEEKNPLTR